LNHLQFVGTRFSCYVALMVLLYVVCCILRKQSVVVYMKVVHSFKQKILKLEQQLREKESAYRWVFRCFEFSFWGK